MTVYIFTGPTLSPDEARAELDAVYLPPAAQGDLYRAALKRPRAIGVIDGYFERVPAVWHKEILWAMKEGVHVFGSASMGALRAVELAPFGMEGVGAIFEAYRDGRLEDDDEVAVAHGPAESGYRAASEAMVNIRATLAAAEAQQVIGACTREVLERIAKDLFYPERRYPLILQRAAEEGLPAAELTGLRAWLPAGRVDQKHADALAMLRRMGDHLAADPPPKRVRYVFEHTDSWEQVVVEAGDLPSGTAAGDDAALVDRLLDELSLDADAYGDARRGALVRLLALHEARERNLSVNPQVLQETSIAFRRERGLLEPEETERWLQEHDLGSAQFARLMDDEARVQWVQALAERQLPGHLPDHLRVSGQYTRLMARAREKQRVLAARGLEHPSLADVGLTDEDLLGWYFTAHLGRPPVEDIAAYARAAGFTDEYAFRRAVLREYCYAAAANRRVWTRRGAQ